MAPEAVAEDAVGWLSGGPRTDRLETDQAILVHRPLRHPWFGVVSRVRAADGVAADSLIALVRDWFAQRGRQSATWMIGASATPADLADRLIGAGAEFEATMTAMVLDHEPPPAPGGVDVRPIEGLEDYRRGLEIAALAFGFGDEDRAGLLDDADEAWTYWQAQPGRVFLLASVDGMPVAEAGMAAAIPGPMVLSGGATLPAWRGRGAYRALVRWRWDEAVRRGTPILVVQASDDSRPILERLGFRTVGPVHTLVDRF